MTIIDMHVHLSPRSSCSILSSEQLFNNISDEIDGICITDHGIVKPMRNLSFNNLLILFGAEISCFEGDLLAYGINTLPLSKKAEDVLNFIHEKNGVAICAHPYSSRHNVFGETIFDYDFDAIEINGAIKKHENEIAKRAAKIMDVPLVGGSDSHSISQLNTVVTLFSNRISCMEDLVNEIKRRRCKPIRL